MKITLNPDYSVLRGFIASIPSLFNADAGTVLYAGRNELRLFEHDGIRIVAKRFKRHSVFKQIIYTFFRKNKARRAFVNAKALRVRGFGTPVEIAYMEDSRMGIVRQVYYVCEYTDMQPIRSELIDKEPFNTALAVDYAHFVADLHDNGVLHRDLNPTNVLFRRDNGSYCFQLIDINRMTFYTNTSVPKAERMENLTLLWELTDMYMTVLGEYAAKCGWTAEDVNRAVLVKKRHDSRWIRRKRFTKALKAAFGRK